jgi:two-component system, NtrC family, sensor kinase
MKRPSLRTELLLNISLLVATALSLAVASVVLLYGALDPDYAPIYISVLVGADVVVLVAFVAYTVERVVLRPLREAMGTAEAIAAGDLQRRLPPGESLEIDNLSQSVNRMTDRLLEERAHLVRAEKLASVGRLAAGVAHEIGNPLGAIHGYVHVLSRAQAGSNGFTDALAGLEREAGRIDRIVRGLLDYARPGTRATGPVDLNHVARNVLDLLAAQGVVKHLTIDFQPDASPVLVVGDRHQLEQALVNLCLNAADAMNGSGRLTVTVRRASRTEVLSGTHRASDPDASRTNMPNARAARWLQQADATDLATLSVADSGPGIPESERDRVFDPFYTTKDPGKGTGLGLAIVARVVENAGGTIWVSPSREGGAAFRILLPAAPRT